MSANPNAKVATRKNFWLWGTWGKRKIVKPFLTQKIEHPIRNVVIGGTFIIALRQDGMLEAWGEDKTGCLGLGTEKQISPEPSEIQFPSEFQNAKSKVIDVQFGKKHVLALTNMGRVYSWGNNDLGQLGTSDQQSRYEPVLVEVGSGEAVHQIIAVEHQSYCLTKSGTVYAWGDNTDGTLCLEHLEPKVQKPEPMLRVKNGGPVKKLELKDTGSSGGKLAKVIIAYVDMAEELTEDEKVGGFKYPLGDRGGAKEGGETRALEAVEPNTEKDIFKGVDLMRKVMDNTQDWWLHMLDVRHGAPYDDNPSHEDHSRDTETDCTALQLDTFVSIDTLEKASYELDVLIQAAKDQLLEMQNERGTKNVKFMLSMFMDDCKLRREKIRRTVSARQLVDCKRAVNQNTNYNVSEVREDQIRRISQENDTLTKQMNSVKQVKAYDYFGRSLQDSIIECIECKLQVHETQIECLKARQGQPADPISASLRTLKERWGTLKRFSIYNLFQECNLRGQNYTFNTDDEMLSYLVQVSDEKIDSIININRDIVSQDAMVPRLCYDLLMENGELRKMCNTYQLKVLLMKGREQGAS